MRTRSTYCPLRTERHSARLVRAAGCAREASHVNWVVKGNAMSCATAFEQCPWQFSSSSCTAQEQWHTRKLKRGAALNHRAQCRATDPSPKRQCGVEHRSLALPARKERRVNAHGRLEVHALRLGNRIAMPQRPEGTRLHRRWRGPHEKEHRLTQEPTGRAIRQVAAALRKRHERDS